MTAMAATQPRQQFTADFCTNKMPLQLALANELGGRLPLYTPEELNVHVTGYRTRSVRHIGDPVLPQPRTLLEAVDICWPCLFICAAIAASGERLHYLHANVILC